MLSASWVLNLSDDTGTIGNPGTSGTTAQVLSTLLQQAAALGVTVFIALGDWGSDNQIVDGKCHLGYPNCDPWVTSCGGTVIGGVSTTTPATFTEVVWSDAHSSSPFGSSSSDFGATGGGVSDTFGVPEYQTAAGIAPLSKNDNKVRRGAPDVAGMVALKGFLMNGSGYSFTGTSCVAPLYAGLTAVLNATLGQSIGFLNPTIYLHGASVCRDVTSGNNTSGDTPKPPTAAAPFYSAGQGWDACTGWGSINGTALLKALRANQPIAGIAVSQQFGLTQTDAFIVDQTGTLNVVWVDGGGAWNGPGRIGPVGAFAAGAPLVASQQFGLTQTDVFLIDKNGTLNVFWVDGGGTWNGPGFIHGGLPPGASLAASRQFGLTQTDVFVVDENGTLNVFWVDGGGAWNGPGLLPGAGALPPGAPLAAIQQFGLTQTDVFAIDRNGTLNVFWVDGGGAWNGPGHIGPAGAFPPGAHIAVSQQFGLTQTDVFVVDKNGTLNVFWVDGGGAWNGPGHIGPAGAFPPGAPLAASQQLGLTQTDVFIVDKSGTLNVFWVDGGGAWQGPGRLGSAGIYAPGAIIAASQQFGLTQTDVFAVARDGAVMNLMWVDGGGAWQGPGALLPG